MVQPCAYHGLPVLLLCFSCLKVRANSKLLMSAVLLRKLPLYLRKDIFQNKLVSLSVVLFLLLFFDFPNLFSRRSLSFFSRKYFRKSSILRWMQITFNSFIEALLKLVSLTKLPRNVLIWSLKLLIAYAHIPPLQWHGQKSRTFEPAQQYVAFSKIAEKPT